jgi:transcriptional regulator CtsR
MLGFPPRVVRGEGLRIGVQMISQRLGRSITDASIQQLFDESLIDKLEKEVFLRASE